MTATPSHRGALVRLILTSVGLPVVVIGAAGWFAISYRLDVIALQTGAARSAFIENVEGHYLVKQAQHTAEAIDRWFIERIADARHWTRDPSVIYAVRSGGGEHPEIDRRVRDFILLSPDFAKVFITDIHGLNVASTDPTSNTLRSDEGWWQQAWHRGLHVGEVEYDDSAEVWSMTLSLRIDDPDGGTPLGVLHAVLALDVVHDTADRAEETLRDDGNVRIAERKGRLIAETKSGHAPERLMQEEVGIAGDVLTLALGGGEPAGLVPGDHVLTAFARTSGSALYDAVSPDFAGLGWIVVVSEATNRMEGELAVLTRIERTLKEQRLILAGILAGIVVASLLMAVILPTGERSGEGGA